MSKIADFVTAELDNVTNECRSALEGARARIAKMSKDRQKDGADSEVLRAAFGQIDRALNGLRSAPWHDHEDGGESIAVGDKLVAWTLGDGDDGWSTVGLRDGDTTVTAVNDGHALLANRDRVRVHGYRWRFRRQR